MGGLAFQGNLAAARLGFVTEGFRRIQREDREEGQAKEDECSLHGSMQWVIESCQIWTRQSVKASTVQANSNNSFAKLTRLPAIRASLALMATTAASRPSFQVAAGCRLRVAKCFASLALSSVP